MSLQQGRPRAAIEPEVVERLVAFTYQFTGEPLWIVRIYSSLFWVSRGIFLFLQELVSIDGAMIAPGIIFSCPMQSPPVVPFNPTRSWCRCSLPSGRRSTAGLRSQLVFRVSFGVSAIPAGMDTTVWALTLAITVVVIACPDALGLASPTGVRVSTRLGAQNGILHKNATALEQPAKLQAIIFDKTSTLTEGKPQVVEIVAVGNPLSRARAFGLVTAN